ncbi:type II toxin-antitoxin system PemK/MazF family toxin [Candidatus Woesearchaeota archaeon]|nr:type II toxin-antitoxin system PemK/MazF family toxin [Candidatus Woesearchaeota archaeon]
MKQRSIILVPFPFSDQSGQKVRPALIISNDEYNSSSDDVIVCAVTTNIKPSKYSVLIGQNDLESGILYEKSAVKAESLLKIKKSLILKTIATINMQTLSKVTAIVKALLNPA